MDWPSPEWVGAAIGAFVVYIGAREAGPRAVRAVREKLGHAKPERDSGVASAGDPWGQLKELRQALREANQAHITDTKAAHAQLVEFVRQFQPVLVNSAASSEATAEMAEELRTVLIEFGKKFEHLDEVIAQLNDHYAKLDRVITRAERLPKRTQP